MAFMYLHELPDKDDSQREKQKAFRSIFNWAEYYEQQQHTDLHKLVFGDKKGDLKQTLLESSIAVINEVDSCNCTALWWACTRGDTSATQLLLEHGADFNISDVEGDSPLHASIHLNGRACAIALLQYGADVNKRNKFGRTPLRVLAHWRDDPDFLEVLISYGADVNVPDVGGFEPLHAAARFGATKNIGVLLKHGANVYAKTVRGLTALELAVQYNNPETAQVLLDWKR
jgi:ankyrin repeat protein